MKTFHHCKRRDFTSSIFETEAGNSELDAILITAMDITLIANRKVVI